MALAFEQIRSDRGINATAQAHHDALFARGGVKRMSHR